ncbi:hypothetical protein Pyn_29881 [Prunus yedoensis var. nudiflora]|uniref:Uncharacterized protein n=1 Tax=Prunus yedoensis var. nudiflora TaxID=2094558 RepID=A0A314YDE4_PRUYE|nr:hypothetical protein Pyn_29881 [Prunus yedoensis var. nudiflora]
MSPPSKSAPTTATALSACVSLRSQDLRPLCPSYDQGRRAGNGCGQAKATSTMSTVGVLSQTDMAEIRSSYQTLPSSSIALRFLHGLKERKVIPLRGWEQISATS